MTLDRTLLVQRLTVEHDLALGVPQMIFFIALFTLLVWLQALQTSITAELRLRQSYTDTFKLDAVEDIFTRQGFFDYLRGVSAASDDVQVLRSNTRIDATSGARLSRNHLERSGGCWSSFLS